MPDNILLELMQQQLTLLEDAVARWSRGSETAWAGDLDGCIHACVDLPADFRCLHNAIFDRLSAGRIQDLNAAGSEYRAIFDRALHLLDTIQGVVATFTDRGRLLQDARKLPAVADDLSRMRKEIFDTWPWFTQQGLDEGRTEIGRGDFATIEEAIDELRRSHLAPGATPAGLLESPRPAPG